MGIAREISANRSAPAEASAPVFVICPADKITGGPELLHQLVGLLRSLGRDARIVYFPFRKGHRVPEPYRQYRVEVGLVKEITPKSMVVVPETSAWKVLKLPKSRIYLWWLSVDNFLKEIVANRSRHFFPASVVRNAALALVRRRATAHLYQSEYARQFCNSQCLYPLYPLSDYLSPRYLEAAGTQRAQTRDNIVVFNPAKGMERTKAILEVLSRSASPIKAIPIQNMDREQVMELLSRAKIYIDFGSHPGKDRLPREAAALGCCVITNRRGSAANARDLPIPAEYKIDDADPTFPQRAVETIIRICGDFPRYATDFDEYRRRIGREPEQFAAEALDIFGGATPNTQTSAG
jgi:hypothetical protein